MRITQWGEYGVHCLTFLARQNSLSEQSTSRPPTANATQISQALKIDELYAQQILQRLRKAGLVASVRGPQGGYKLARPADDITLCDILTASEGQTFSVICENKPIDHECCGTDLDCNLKSIWMKLRTHVDEFLKHYRLTDLAKEAVPAALVTKISGSDLSARSS